MAKFSDTPTITIRTSFLEHHQTGLWTSHAMYNAGKISGRRNTYQRYRGHISTLGGTNGGLTPGHSILNDIPQREIKHELDAIPSLGEVEECVHNLGNRKLPGGDWRPAEIYKYGGVDVLQSLHLFPSRRTYRSRRTEGGGAGGDNAAHGVCDVNATATTTMAVCCLDIRIHSTRLERRHYYYNMQEHG